jgi:Tol biopolymer transport system component
MNHKKVLALCFALVLILGNFHVFAQTAEELFSKGVQLEEVKGELEQAIKAYRAIVEKYSDKRPIAAKALLHIGLCYEKLGKETARNTYNKLISEFSDQVSIVNEAKTRLANLNINGQPKSNELTVKRIWSKFPIIPKNLQNISPDGKYIAGVHQMNGDLCISDLHTKTIKYLTDFKIQYENFMKTNPNRAQLDSFENSGEIPLGSAWSSDGSNLASVWCNWEDRTGELRIMTTDGKIKETILLLENLIWPYVRDWSNDNRKILIEAKNEEGSISFLVIDLLDKKLKTLKKKKDWSSTVHFSPDGSFVVYDLPVERDKGKRDIYTLSLRDSMETLLIENSGDDYVLGWFPKGDRILFASDRSGSLDAWSINVNEGKPSGQPVLVKNDIGHIWPLGISQDGTFYYAIRQEQRDIYLTILSEDGRKVVKQPERVTNKFFGKNTQPAWSPNGNQLAYISNRGLQGKDPSIVIQLLDSGDEREYQTDFREINSATWGLHSTSMLLTGVDAKNCTGIFKFNLENKITTPIYLFPENYAYGSWAAWLPGMDKLIFTHRRSGSDRESKIKIYNVATKEAKEIDNESTWFLCESLNPSKEYFTFRNWGEMIDNVVSIPVEGGERRTIAEFDSGYVSSIAWAPDGKKIYIALRGETNDERLLLKDIQSGELIDLGLQVDYMRELDIHPDGTKLVFQARKINFEIWAMENIPEK